MNVTVARYALGVAALLVISGSLAAAAAVVRRRYFPGWTGALARLCESLIALALLIAILELLGTIGLFRLLPIVLACLAVAVVVARATGGAESTHARVRGVRGFGTAGPLKVIALILAAAVIAEWTSPTLQSYDVGIRTFDTVWYHLPWAASFVQTAHITPLRFTDIEYLTAFYPATAELLHGLGIAVLARDTLSPALNLLWLGGVLLAAWCVGRPRGVAPLTLSGAALAMATPMMNFSQGGSAANDVVGVFFLIAAVALLVNAEGRPAAYVLAAVAAGLAIAVKLSTVAAVVALTVGVIAIAPAGRRRARTALWVLPLVVAGGFWYLRNLIAVGNPLPWTSFGILPTPDPPLQQHTGYAVVHYFSSSTAWRNFFEPGLASGLGRWWYLIVGGAVVGPLLCLLPGAGRLTRMLGLVALATLAAYLITPETAAGPAGDPLGFAFNLRYAAPALTLALVVLPLAGIFATPGRGAALLVAIVAVLVATVWQAPLWPSAHVIGAVILGIALLTTALAVRVVPRTALLLAAVVLLLAGTAAGYAGQRRYLRGRYVFSPGVSYIAKVWAAFRSIRHSRVGLAGTFGGFASYPLYGIDDSNRVQYIAARGRHGSFTAITSCSSWRAAVNAGHFRYLVLTPSRDPWHPKRLLSSPEEAWTGSDPAARVILIKRAQGQQFTVYKLSGPLNTASCGQLAH